MGMALAVAAHAAFAQSYPDKPIRLLVPFPPGAATDVAARIIGQQLQTELGQAIVVDNKPGANGSIAGLEVVRAAPDGYTLMFSSNSAIASNIALLKNMPYDPLKALTPIAGVAENTLVLMVKPTFPAKTLKDFIAYASARPGKLSAGYGSSSSQVSLAMLNKLAGLDTLPVPYKGIPLAANDVVGGTLDFTFVDLGNAMAQTKGGLLRPIAVTSEKRSPLVPDWPTLSELIPGYNITAWFGVVGPAKLPKPIVDKLNAAIVKSLAQPEVKTRMAGIGLTTMPLTPPQLGAFMASEVTKWQRLVKESGIEPE
jgi:tripartite-type tricarboxylate transporter receptor subunit TctC